MNEPIDNLEERVSFLIYALTHICDVVNEGVDDEDKLIIALYATCNHEHTDQAEVPMHILLGLDSIKDSIKKRMLDMLLSNMAASGYEEG